MELVKYTKKNSHKSKKSTIISKRNDDKNIQFKALFKY